MLSEFIRRKVLETEQRLDHWYADILMTLTAN